MKRLIIRVSSLFKGFVLALIFSVFLQASLASANGAIELNQGNFYSTIDADISEEDGSIGGNYKLIESINIADVNDAATVFGTFTGILDGNGKTISGLTKPLFDVIGGDVSDLNLASGLGIDGNGALANTLNLGGTIDNVSFTGDVDGDFMVGGLVGYSEGNISNSNATGTVEGFAYAGGLVGFSVGNITNSYAIGTVDGDVFIGGLVGYSEGNITNSYAIGTVYGTNDVGGLVGSISEFGNITNSYAIGTVYGTNDVGGLAGFSNGEINNSYAIGTVYGTNDVGGLVGDLEGNITNSYATRTVDGTLNVGGLVGSISEFGTITTSYASGTVYGTNSVGGLAGFSNGEINNSYAAGDVSGIDDFVGGLAGYSLSNITNSYAIGDVSGVDSLGGLVGSISEIGTINNSYATGDVTSIITAPDFVGGLVGYSAFKDGEAESDVQISLSSYSTGAVIFNTAPQISDMYAGLVPAPNILDIVDTGFEAPNLPFAVSASINDGLPYLISLLNTYDVVEEDTEEIPSYSLRSYYTQAAKSLDKALISFGFKSNFSSHPNLGFQALEQNQSNSPAVIQLFEVSEYQNSNILLNKEDGLQLSISSYYKEPVEIWTQGLNGEYLYLGLVEFDKDGKAILPTLKFDTANTFQLLMIKAADKVSGKPNLEAQLGQININVF